MNKTFFHYLKLFCIIISFYPLLFWLWYTGDHPSGENEWSVLPFVMIVIAIATIWATIKLHERLLFVLASVSFFPVGYYFLLGNSLFSMSIGICYLILIALAVALYVGTPKLDVD